jgi:hypothetical protein
MTITSSLHVQFEGTKEDIARRFTKMHLQQPSARLAVGLFRESLRSGIPFGTRYDAVTYTEIGNTYHPPPSHARVSHSVMCILVSCLV